MNAGAESIGDVQVGGPTARLKRQIAWLLPPVAVAAVIGWYNLIFFNKYFPLTEGWFSLYAALIRRGKVPYRDFDLYLSPLYPLILALVPEGTAHFLVLRTIGVGVILTMSVLLYAILSRMFGKLPAFFGSVIAIVYYQSGVAHITYDFTQFLSLFTLAAIYFQVRFTDRLVSRYEEAWGCMILAGAFAGCAFLTKQSNGFFVVAFGFLASLVHASPPRWRIVVRHALWYVIGVFIPVALIVAYLGSQGAIGDAVSQVFGGASRAKGSTGHILFGWMQGFFSRTFFLQLKDIIRVLWPFGVANVVCALLIGRSRFEPIARVVMWSAALSGVIAAIVLAYYFHFAVDAFIDVGHSFVNYIIVIAIAATVVAVAYGALTHSFVDAIGRRLLMVSIFSAGMIFGNGTSAGLSEVGCFLGFGLFISAGMCMAYDLLLTRGALIGLSCCYLAFLAESKFEHPYAWWGVQEPDVRSGRAKCAIPELAGMDLSTRTVEVVDAISSRLQTPDSAGLTMFCYPHIPQFYLFAHRFPTTRGKIHWFDFMPDEGAIRDAHVLAASPPDQLVLMRLPPEVMLAHERLFRGGHEMGQRQMIIVLENLIRSGQYHRMVEFSLPNTCSIELWEADRMSPGSDAEKLRRGDQR
jgi:hypothetical protein